MEMLELSAAQQRAALAHCQERNRLVGRFKAIVEVLTELGYIDGWSVTPAGRMLTSIHREQDLLVAEVIRAGVLDPLGGAELAGVASVLVYEHRSRSEPAEPALPNANCESAVSAIRSIREGLIARERASGLDLTPSSSADDGFFNHAYAWAAGAPLSEVVGDAMSVGDFIRNIKALVDLLRQIAGATSEGGMSARAIRVANSLARRRDRRRRVVADWENG